MLSLHLTEAASTVDEGIQKKKKNHGSRRSLDLAERTTILIISNEEIEFIMKLVKFLGESSLLIKCKNKRIDFLVCY